MYTPNYFIPRFAWEIKTGAEKPMELEALRETIRDADEQIAALFVRRMEAAREIAAYKRDHGLPVEDPAQEARVLSGRGKLIADEALRPYYLDFLRGTMDVSKRWQRRFYDDGALRVSLGAASYDVVLRCGCLAEAGTLLDLDRRVLVVTDEGVPARYAEAVAAQCASPLVFTAPEGETCKTPAVLQRLLETMLRSGFTRGDCVCAVGGGAVGDLAGLAAALYMRGIDFYNVPTTLLAQADSCVGGKTGIDLSGVKNAAGVIRQPKKVLIDPEVLDTLLPEAVACGMAEALKAGLIGDASLFARFETGEAARAPEQTVAAALRVKIRIVEQDVSERGARRALNFGHTIGHAIESVTGLPHGACVALGMLPMCAPPLRPRLERILERLGLPTSVQADRAAVYSAMTHDKKTEDGRIRAVFVETPGSCEIRAVAPETLRDGIDMVVKE